jgi:hypothetical protein
MYSYVLLVICLYQYVLVCTGMYRHAKIYQKYVITKSSYYYTLLNYFEYIMYIFLL